MDSVQEQILEKLAQQGISAEDIDFRGSDGKATYFRYRYWSPLPEEAFIAISNLVYEDLYEDEDGDDERGRPIIRRMWNYQIKTA